MHRSLLKSNTTPKQRTATRDYFDDATTMMIMTILGCALAKKNSVVQLWVGGWMGAGRQWKRCAFNAIHLYESDKWFNISTSRPLPPPPPHPPTGAVIRRSSKQLSSNCCNGDDGVSWKTTTRWLRGTSSRRMDEPVIQSRICNNNAGKTGMRLHDYFVVVLLHNSNLSRTGCGWRIRALCKCNPSALNGPYLSFSSHLREVAYWSGLVWSPDQFCPSMSVR